MYDGYNCKKLNTFNVIIIITVIVSDDVDIETNSTTKDNNNDK